MGLIVSDEEAKRMENWQAIVDDFNKAAYGMRSPYRAKEVRPGPNGELLLVLEPKPDEAETA